jgi:hypothetical protein
MRRGTPIWNFAYVGLMVAYFLPLMGLTQLLWPEADAAIRTGLLFALAIVAGIAAGWTLHLLLEHRS